VPPATFDLPQGGQNIGWRDFLNVPVSDERMGERQHPLDF
jgi:hypothetical protein